MHACRSPESAQRCFVCVCVCVCVSLLPGPSLTHSHTHTHTHTRRSKEIWDSMRRIEHVELPKNGFRCVLYFNLHRRTTRWSVEHDALSWWLERLSPVRACSRRTAGRRVRRRGQCATTAQRPDRLELTSSHRHADYPQNRYFGQSPPSSRFFPPMTGAF